MTTFSWPKDSLTIYNYFQAYAQRCKFTNKTMSSSVEGTVMW